MSKVDAQRAMREAKYAQRNASGLTRSEVSAAEGRPRTATTRTPVTQDAKPVKAAKPAKATAAAAAPASGERCGHKSMNGRECTRPAAHPEKSHRYG